MKLTASSWGIWAAPPARDLYYEPRGIRRLIFQKHYNIYYTLRDNTLFVLFIFDGRMGINQDIEEHGLDTDDLIG